MRHASQLVTPVGLNAWIVGTCRCVGTAFSEKRSIWMNGPSILHSAGSNEQAQILQHAGIEVNFNLVYWLTGWIRGSWISLHCYGSWRSNICIHLSCSFSSRLLPFFLIFTDGTVIFFSDFTDCCVHSMGPDQRAWAWHLWNCKLHLPHNHISEILFRGSMSISPAILWDCFNVKPHRKRALWMKFSVLKLRGVWFWGDCILIFRWLRIWTWRRTCAPSCRSTSFRFLRKLLRMSPTHLLLLVGPWFSLILFHH